jgi:hypothetical protein
MGRRTNSPVGGGLDVGNGIVPKFFDQSEDNSLLIFGAAATNINFAVGWAYRDPQFTKTWLHLHLRLLKFFLGGGGGGMCSTLFKGMLCLNHYGSSHGDGARSVPRRMRILFKRGLSAARLSIGTTEPP